MRLRVDLDARLWCEGNCLGRPSRILREDAYKIVFEDGKDGDDSEYYAVDRTTGKITQDDITNGERFTYNGTCEPATFTGFPEPHPKF